MNTIIFGILLFLLIYFLRGKVPFLGMLPGDIFLDMGNFKLFFPFTSAILISIVLSLIRGIFK